MSSDSARKREKEEEKEEKGDGQQPSPPTLSPVFTSEEDEREEPGSLPTTKPFTADLHLDCGTLEYAGIVRRSLSVEPELRPTMITRTMTSDQNGTLHIHFEAVDIKSLRASVGSILELAQVSLQTITELAPQAA